MSATRFRILPRTRVAMLPPIRRVCTWHSSSWTQWNLGFAAGLDSKPWRRTIAVRDLIALQEAIAKARRRLELPNDVPILQGQQQCRIPLSGQHEPVCPYPECATTPRKTVRHRFSGLGDLAQDTRPFAALRTGLWRGVGGAAMFAGRRVRSDPSLGAVPGDGVEGGLVDGAGVEAEFLQTG